MINNSRLGFYGEIAHDTSLALTTAMASTRIGSPYTGYLPTQNWLPKLARLSLSSTTVDYLPAAHNVKRPPTVSNGLAAESESLEMITHQELGQALALQNADYRLATNSTRMTRRQVSAGVGEVLPFLAAEAITRVCDASTSQPIGPVSVAIKTAGPLLVGFSGRAKIGGIPSTTFAAGAYAAGYCASRLLDKQIDPVDWTMSGNYKRGPLFGTYIDQLLGLDTK